MTPGRDAPAPPLAGAARGVVLRALGTGLLVLLLASGLVRAGTRLVERRAPDGDPWGTARPREALLALPALAAQGGRQVLLFGSSNVQDNLRRASLEAAWRARGIEASAVNFGFGGLDGVVQRLLAERVRDAYTRADRRLALAVVEIDPTFLTLRRRTGPFAKRYDQLQALLASPADLAREILRSPEHGLRIASYRVFLGGVSPSAITALAERWIRARFAPPPPDTTRPEAWRAAMRDAAAAARRAEPRRRYWSLERAGFPVTSPDLDAARAAAARVPQPASLGESERRWREECCDAIELRFDDEALAALAEAVRTLASVADAAVLFVSPTNASMLVPSAEGQRRLDAAIARLVRESGAPLVALPDDAGLGPEDYLDASHVNVFGEEKLSHALAQALAPYLSR